VSLSSSFSSIIFELRLTGEKSNFKTKNCPGVTIPSAISFCTSSPYKKNEAVSLAGQTNWGHSCEPGRSIYVHPYTGCRESVLTCLPLTTFRTGEDGKKGSAPLRMHPRLKYIGCGRSKPALPSLRS
jgi:hypothetical protein